MPALAAVPSRADVLRWAHDLYANAVDHKDAAGHAVPAITIVHLAGAGTSGQPVTDQCRIYVDLAPPFAA